MPPILTIFGTFYNSQFQSHPIRTACIANGLLAGVSDSLTQTFFATNPEDHVRPPPPQPLQDTGNDKERNERDNSSSLTGKDVDQHHISINLERSHRYSNGNTQQQAEGHFDVPRLGRFMFYNFAVAPLIQTWYTVLDKQFPWKSSAGVQLEGSAASKKKLFAPRFMTLLGPGLKRMATDQIFFAPIGLALLFSGLTFLEGGGVTEIKEKLNKA
ncbi:hypothetical protein BG004_006895, partial [Podila humilis]